MIRTMLMLIFWALAAPVAAIIGFTASFIMGDVRVLYRLFMWGAWAGVWITGRTGRNRRPRSVRPFAQLHLYDESCFQS